MKRNVVNLFTAHLDNLIKIIFEARNDLDDKRTIYSRPLFTKTKNTIKVNSVQREVRHSRIGRSIYIYDFT